jgi:2-aminoadipate transaminase
VIHRLVQLKQGTDLHTSSFNQMMVYEAAKDGFLDEHVRRLRQVYRERRDVMLEALAREFPPEAQWTRPLGGLFLWVQLPAEVDIDDLLREAVANEVAFVPGHAFFIGDDPPPTMRLNFSNAQPAQIEEGIRRLGVAVRRVLREAQPMVTAV